MELDLGQLSAPLHEPHVSASFHPLSLSLSLSLRPLILAVVDWAGKRSFPLPSAHFRRPMGPTYEVIGFHHDDQTGRMRSKTKFSHTRPT